MRIYNPIALTICITVFLLYFSDDYILGETKMRNENYNKQYLFHFSIELTIAYFFLRYTVAVREVL